MEHEREIGVQLRNINNSIRRLVDNQPINKAMNKMTGTNAWLIAYIAEQTDKGRDVFQRDIEEHFGITRSCVSRVIGLMEQKGFIERKEVLHDARLKKLVLTKEAAVFAVEMKKDAKQMEKRLMSGFSDDERNMLISYLDRIMANLENDMADLSE